MHERKRRGLLLGGVAVISLGASVIGGRTASVAIGEPARPPGVTKPPARTSAVGTVAQSDASISDAVSVHRADPLAEAADRHEASRGDLSTAADRSDASETHLAVAEKTLVHPTAQPAQSVPLADGAEDDAGSAAASLAAVSAAAIAPTPSFAAAPGPALAPEGIAEPRTSAAPVVALGDVTPLSDRSGLKSDGAAGEATQPYEQLTEMISTSNAAHPWTTSTEGLAQTVLAPDQAASVQQKIVVADLQPLPIIRAPAGPTTVQQIEAGAPDKASRTQLEQFGAGAGFLASARFPEAASGGVSGAPAGPRQVPATLAHSEGGDAEPASELELHEPEFARTNLAAEPSDRSQSAADSISSLGEARAPAGGAIPKPSADEDIAASIQRIHEIAAEVRNGLDRGQSAAARRPGRVVEATIAPAAEEPAIPTRQFALADTTRQPATDPDRTAGPAIGGRPSSLASSFRETPTTSVDADQRATLAADQEVLLEAGFTPERLAQMSRSDLARQLVSADDRILQRAILNTALQLAGVSRRERANLSAEDIAETLFPEVISTNRLPAATSTEGVGTETSRQDMQLAMSTSSPLARTSGDRQPSAPDRGGTATNGAASVDAGTAVAFNSELLMRPAGGRSIDVSRFEHGNPTPAGSYRVDVYVNGAWTGRTEIRFEAATSQASATPCYDKALLRRLPLDFTALSNRGGADIAKLAEGECLSLAQVVAGASETFDLSELRLDLSIPQAMLLRTPRGYVPPEFLDEGVPSATLGYNLNATRQDAAGEASTSAYLGLNAGANLGGWHFRHNSALSYQPNGAVNFQDISTYVQHDLPSIRSQLTLGESFTDGMVFDSIGIRGVQLATDDRMLPDSQRGYAPLIRGVADSNARVTVTQNGNKLYETTVAPGPFEINDLYPTGYGGNLLVTVTEANGSQRSFTVPYASLVQLLRPGVTRFSVAAGELRDAQLPQHPAVLQATVQHGFTNAFTGYAGLAATPDYLAGLVGVALNTNLGAFAVDLTQAKASITGLSATAGQSLRVSYSKLVPSTKTNFSVVAYRYSSSGYWALRDAALANAAALAGNSPNAAARQRNQIQLSVNQNFGRTFGSLYAAASVLDYWNRPGSTTQFQVGYNNTLRFAKSNVSYNIAASRERDGMSGQMDNRVTFGLSMALGRGAHAPMLNTSVTHDRASGTSEQGVLSGTLGVDNQFNYGLNLNNSPGGGTSGGVNGQYRSPYATLSASASAGPNYTQFSGRTSGAIVLHPGGLSFANDLGDTVAVVEAKDAAGARITNSSGVRIDGHGYAVIPYLTPYRMNTVDIDPKGMSLDVQLASTSQQVAPRANSVVMVRFPTAAGRTAVISAKLPNGQAVPFGAEVQDAKGGSIGLAGQDGRIFASGLADRGTLAVRWGEGAEERCAFAYELPAKSKDQTTYPQIGAVCTLGEASASKAPGNPPQSDTQVDAHAMGATTSSQQTTK